MVETPDPQGHPGTTETSPRGEREHARRNAQQLELLRLAYRRLQHQAFVEQALRRVRQEQLR
jgi:hypothetical protein